MNKLFKSFSFAVVLFFISITLFACGKTYTITFKEDGKIVETIKTSDKAKKPKKIPSKEGYIFEGWFIKGTDEQLNIKKPITKDLEVEARFKKIETEKEDTKNQNLPNNDTNQGEKDQNQQGDKQNNTEPKGDSEKDQNDGIIEDNDEGLKVATEEEKATLKDLVSKVEALVKEKKIVDEGNIILEDLNEAKELLKNNEATSEDVAEYIENLKAALEYLSDDNLKEDNEESDNQGDQNTEEEKEKEEDKKKDQSENEEDKKEDQPVDPKVEKQPENNKEEKEEGNTEETPNENKKTEDQEKPNNQESQKVELTVKENQNGNVSLELEFKLEEKITGFNKLQKEEIEAIKESYLEFLTLNNNKIESEKLTLDMSTRNFKITIKDLNLNDILDVKEGIIIKAKNKTTQKVSDIAVSTNSLKLRYNGVYFVKDNKQPFTHIQAQKIQLEKSTITISKDHEETIKVTFSPNESKGELETILPDDSEIKVNIDKEKNLITVSTTSAPEEEKHVQLTIILKEGQIEKDRKIVTVNIVKDVNNSSTSEENIIKELTFKSGGTNTYESGEAIYTNKQGEEVTLNYVNGYKNNRDDNILVLSGYNPKNTKLKGTLTLKLENNNEKVKKIVLNLKSYKADEKQIGSLNVILTKKDKSKITKNITKEQISLDSSSDVTIDLADEAEAFTQIDFEVVKNEDGKPKNNKPRVAIYKITLYK